MSQLQTWLWGYFREHGRLPESSSTFAQMVDMALEEEVVPLALEVAAMRIVEDVHGDGRDLPPERAWYWGLRRFFVRQYGRSWHRRQWDGDRDERRGRA